MMLGKKLLSCTQLGYEFNADFSEKEPNSALAFGALLEIQKIKEAASQIKLHEYAAINVQSNPNKYSETLDQVVEYIENLKSDIGKSQEQISWFLYKN